MLSRDEDMEPMNMKRSIGWVALGVGTLVVMGALAFALGYWHTHSLDEQGRALVAGREYLPAIRVLSGVVATTPGDARAHYYLGLAYAGVGRCGAAWMHIDEAARLAPMYRRLRASPGLACRDVASMRATGPDRSRGHE
jgi:cytochrome c-type biogenesis protein CcmH/NrfG